MASIKKSFNFRNKKTLFDSGFTLTNKIGQGFTLIELLVGLSILVIVFTVGISGYREFSRRQALTGVIKEIKGNIRLIQQLALTGQKPEGLSCPTLNSYTFTRSSSTIYTLTANCVNSSGVPLNHDIKSVDLTNSSVTITSTNPSIVFKVLGQGTSLSSANTITLTHVSGSQTTLVIGVGGEIR